MTIQTKHVLKIFLLIMQILFLLEDNTILLRLESLKEWLISYDLKCSLKCSPGYIFIFLAYNILREVVELFFSDFFQSSFPEG